MGADKRVNGSAFQVAMVAASGKDGFGTGIPNTVDFYRFIYIFFVVTSVLE